MFQVWRAVRANQLEFWRVDEQLVTRGYKHPVIVKSDATQTAIPTPSLPIDVAVVPIDGLPDPLTLQIDQKNTAMTVTLLTAANHRCGDQCFHYMKYLG